MTFTPRKMKADDPKRDATSLNNPLSLKSAPVEMSPASPHEVEWDCPPQDQGQPPRIVV
jgi:hypothetical protein